MSIVSAVNYIQNKINERTSVFTPFDNSGKYVLRLEEAQHVIDLLNDCIADEGGERFERDRW